MKNEKTKNKAAAENPITIIPESTTHLRILDAEERTLFTPEAWNELNNYLTRGVINIDQFEFIIAKLSEVSVRDVDVENLKSIIDSVIIMQSTKASSLGNVVFIPKDVIS